MTVSLRPMVCVAAFAATTVMAHAWVDVGHMLIATIARHELTIKARDEADRLLKVGATERTAEFVTAACWADDVRRERPESSTWHYIDFHFKYGGAKTDNKPDKENAAWAIDKFSAVLKDASKPDAERADALRFLIHFVGDIHQPLHGTARDTADHPTGDRGGNDFAIKSPSIFKTRPPRNLHSLWDLGGGLFSEETRPLDARGERRLEAQAYTLVAAMPRSSFRTVTNANPLAWAKESFEAAKRFAYATTEGQTPSDAYMANCWSVSAQRATLAGYRLADLLNRLLN